MPENRLQTKAWKTSEKLDVIVNEVLNEELKEAAPNAVGITTPYRAQADKAKTHISSDGLQIDTVYKYQGREKDIFISESFPIIQAKTATGIQRERTCFYSDYKKLKAIKSYLMTYLFAVARLL
jgi:hypothetical protein